MDKKIFYNDKILIFTSRQVEDSELSMVVDNPNALQLTKVLKKAENSKILYLISRDREALFDRFRSFFTPLRASGGVVIRSGDVLLIFRGGVWDLPKGHIEQGESSQQCALREVEEECGIGGLVLGERILTTEHIYLIGEQWHIKSVDWYMIAYDGGEDGVPQVQEGIERVLWVALDEVDEYLKNTYSTIVEVFLAMKNKKNDNIL